MSPRRSSRARLVQAANGAQPARSSASSTSSSRAERNTRSHTKPGSPLKGTTPRSHSSDDRGDAPAAPPPDQPQTRRQKRADRDGEDAAGPPALLVTDHDVGPDEDEDADADAAADADDEDVTRCVCGQLDYPGPSSRAPLQDENSPDAAIEALDPAGDELGSLFIQCDTCKVWQHGGCVGIMEESMSPDEYFCELCRHDLHEIALGPRGPRTSRYIPVVGPTSPKAVQQASLPKDGESRPSKTKASNQAAFMAGSKRRSTMNSRDAAYDEEEQFRRAIEVSKAEKQAARGRATGRKGKRRRSDSEDTKQSPTKRQRTSLASARSNSPAHQDPTAASVENERDPSSEKTASETVSRRRRGSAARLEQEKELRDRAAEREKEREEAAGRRKGRAERRRGEDPDPADDMGPSRPSTGRDAPELGSQARESTGAAIDAEPEPERETSAPTPAPAAPTNALRKSGRAPARRGRVGRNQYTKDDGAGKRDSSARGRSPSHDEGNGNGHGHGHGSGKPPAAGSVCSIPAAHVNGDSGRPSRPRYMHPQRTTMNEMKRRVAAILEFISRIQVDMAGEKTPPVAGGSAINGGSSANGASSTSVLAAAAMINSLAAHLPTISLTTTTTTTTTSTAAEDGHHDDHALPPSAAVVEKDFGDLTSLEMMDVLTRKLVLWQKEYGKWGDK
ncbi:MAG: hypothetical protein M1826_000523 [Phylliscum demangeonii]|nr:MAG: hypothetical protein M1826_000523 [Phylliscum demangeonii]